MIATDKQAFVAVLVGLAAIKPGKGLTPEALEIWWAAMARWELDEFKSAAAHLASSIQFMPSPYDFEQLRKAGEPTAGEAWEEVLSGCLLEPGSRTDRAAQICGGQYEIRHADIETALPHIMRRFIQVYDELSDVDPARDALPSIVKQDWLTLSAQRLKRITLDD